MESSRPKVTQSSMSSATSAKSGGATVYIPSPSLLLQRTQRVYSSALTATTAATSLPGEHHQLPKTSHVVKIQIPRIEHQSAPRVDGVQTSTHTKSSTRVSIVPIVVDRVPNKLSKDSQAPFQHHTDQPKITDMVQKHENPATELDVVTNSSYLYYIPNSMRSSGQCSPDTLDSGTCSDMEATPPPLPKKMSKMPVPGGSGSVSPVHQQQASSTPSGSPQPPVNGRHVRNGSVTDSEESESSLSCDSLNCGDVLVEKSDGGKMLLPDSLLKDIRKRSAEQESDVKVDFTIASMQHRDEIAGDKDLDPIYDRFYKFYINEYVQDPVTEGEPKIVDTSDESFAGFRDIHSGTSTIRSAKGTIRGVKNRVRNGIVTFQQMQSNLLKNYKEKDAGKVVLYTTSMGIVRETYAKCNCVKQILRTLLVKFEERDVFMSTEYQQEIKDRMQCDNIDVPQLFVDGQHIGNADTVERLNEEGELRKMLKAYKCLDPSYTCKMCGGYRLLPCPSCNGSKKSVHRNHFTAEFVSLKCMNCDSSGLIFCNFCKTT